MTKMRYPILTVLLLSFGLLSCNQNLKNDKDNEINVSPDSINTNQYYHYQIAENISLESTIPSPVFDIDSIESYSYYANGGKYSFIKDQDGRIFFSVIVAEMSPALFIEGIYPDYENAKVRYFIFNDTEVAKENRNRIFVGTLLSQSEQLKVQDYINSSRNVGAISPQMWTPNSFDVSSNFRPIIKSGTQHIVTSNSNRQDSVISIEPIKRNRFGRKQQWETLQFDD